MAESIARGTRIFHSANPLKEQPTTSSTLVSPKYNLKKAIRVSRAPTTVVAHSIPRSWGGIHLWRCESRVVLHEVPYPYK